MRGRRAYLVVGALVLWACAGCARMKKHSSVATMEPAYVGEGAVDGAIVDPAAGHPVTFVDRHPILSKPRDVYHNTNHHGVVKAAAATVVGVTMGVVCEVGQVFKGCPPGL